MSGAAATAQVRRVKKAFDYVDGAMSEAMQRVLEARHYYLGPENEAFEAEVSRYLGCEHAVAVNSGTSGMFLILKALQIGPGDEVVVPAMGFVTLAEAVAVTGAKPVFADVEPETYNLDPESVRSVITEATKAIVPAHKYGHPADLDALGAIASERGIAVVEDACHAFGGAYRGRRTGPIGRAGFLSFAGKSISVCGLGGMVVTNDADLANEVRLLRDHGRPRARGERFYDIQRIGYNLRLSEIHAAIGRVQLEHLESWNEARRQRAAELNAGLSEAGAPVRLPRTLPDCVHAFLHYTIAVPEGHRDALRAHVHQAGVDASVLYPQDLHLIGPYQELVGHVEGDFPVAERLTSEVLSLPNHPGLADEDVGVVVEAVASFYR